ncbi:MAG: hypothetical protein WCG07_03175 [Candidatus Taylorbacteria bacterium]
MKHIYFIREAVKNFRLTGSLMPSQRFLVNKLVAPVPRHARCVIELGAGEGCVTRALEEKVSPECIILSFEINPDLSDMYKSRRPSTIQINDSAEQLEHYIKKYNLADNIDCVVSSLPLASLPKHMTRSILGTIAQNMPSTGKYIQFQYSLLNKKDIGSHFDIIKTHFVPLNILPAFVYVCTKK